MNKIVLVAVLTAVLIVLSLVAFITTLVMSKKLAGRTKQILVILLPVEFFIISWGTPFLLALCFFLR